MWDQQSFSALCALARERINSGALPRCKALCEYIAHGSGKVCALCSKQIGTRDMESEALYESDPACLFHIACFDAWSHERRSLSPGP